ncbi:hypothetical protein [Paulownia witches'-broom phytoplasma]|uniref:hypothetical protein n=1 Tax=Paulownia witches'-broom phytoplasma TaxID=39647 RepID=UPI0030D70116
MHFQVFGINIHQAKKSFKPKLIVVTTKDSAPNVFGVLNRTSDSLKAKIKKI